MTLTEIIEEVRLIVHDEGYTDAEITAYINLALVKAAAFAKLPDLKALSTIETADVPYVSLTGLTGGFSGELIRVNRSGYGNVTIVPSLDLLLDEYSSSDYPALTEAGSVEAVALEGRVLWYQYVPAAAETLTILYRKNPTSLSAGTDEPSVIPDHTHRGLLVHGTAFIMFDEIEDGLEGEKENTKNQFYHSFDERSKHSGITQLREWVSKTRVSYKSSVWRY